ncbi:PREDICTED: leucine-rich repeat serine/threonine-protein kinase 1-like [Amphimedon queenslandica]|uniref:non-specific serine/threonine protein kinase n=1 Tax=Amphimedon queenslandica TaxID=400682 RepID=A0A1X7VUS5_AMPQE|nr:PREDICTED: leucine-rich repeat serine/threonine-protein kinase 1-like [Amphimedon queenslandica]|eukprot:XP_019849257.1 PREDICTED: leucine-rich repeat serine/threonine-protein kinase 1-like [Amphimedon queenslandica]
MARGSSFLRFFEPSVDPSLVDDTDRLIDFLSASERLPRLLSRKDDRGYTLLHYAAERDRPESLKILLINGADPNIRTSHNSFEITPLHIAAANGHLDCLKRLVESGGDPLLRDSKNRLPRDHAQGNRQELCLEYLQKESAERVQHETEELQEVLLDVSEYLEAGDFESLFNYDNFNKSFPLDSSKPTPTTPEDNIIERHCNLLNNSTLVHSLSRFTRDFPISLHYVTILHAAVQYNHISLVSFLVSNYPSLLTQPSSEGYTALHVAVSHKCFEIVQILTEAYMNIYRQRSSSVALAMGGANPRIRAPPSEAPLLFSPTNTGHTPLHMSVALCEREITLLFLSHAKQLSLSLEGSACGYTALHLAVHFNQPEMAALLLSNGANPNATLAGEMGGLAKNPLAEAAINNNPLMIRTLVSYGAEDRRHDALNYALSQDMTQPNGLKAEVIPLLFGSLVKCDENATKTLAQSRKEPRSHRHKMAVVEWNGLDMTEFKPEWFYDSLNTCPLFVSQSLTENLCLKFINRLNISKNKLTFVPIEFFRLQNLTTLNLSHNCLGELPDVVPMATDSTTPTWPCGSLNKLDISHNQLKELPIYLFELPQLSILDASHNQLTALPVLMWSAPKLSSLNCSHNTIQEIPTNLSYVMENYDIIDIAGANGPPGASVTSPTQTLSGLSSPRSKASTRRVSTDPAGASIVQSYSDNCFTDDSSRTTDDNMITPDKVRQTRLYDRLNVCNANLTIEWDALEGKQEIFDGLNNLNLSHNEIKVIPSNLPCLCPKLTRLDLSHNGISDLALPRAVPSNLKQLNVSHNDILRLDSYKSRVEQLPCTNPKTLINSGGTIYRDPSKPFCSHRSHNHLISLAVLDASHNQIADVKLYSPVHLVSDRGGKIKVTDIPLFAALASASGQSQDRVRQLAKLACPLLTRLVLHHNQIAEVPPSVCDMTSLNSVDLSWNNIIELRPSLGKLGNLWEFPLDGLQLISPPHNIIDRGKTKDIIGFLWSLLQRARPYHRMKLMLVGKAGRGKTTLLRKISEKGQSGIQENLFLTRMSSDAKKFQKDLSTVGIVVSDWTYTTKHHSDQTQTGLRNITFMTWDFGGQEEYYATHQCFLSRRSLYLVVWNVTHGREGVLELKPWLLNIQARAPNSPVIIVGTHYDKVKRSQRHLVTENVELINRLYGSGSRLMHRQHGFPTIMYNVVVSCTSGSNINDLRDKIFDVACQVKENTVTGRGIGCGRIPEYRLLMDQLVPASYLQLEDSVRSIALTLRLLGKPPVLTYKEFKEYVFGDARTLVSRDVGDRELEQAVRFLHDNGTLLHYDDPLLKELYFVDPQWLSDMLAHIVTVREINPFVKDGIMKIKDFTLLFNDKDFPIHWQKQYLRLLTTFEVAVEFKEGKLLIPSHLPELKPALSHCYPPENTVYLPPLRHTYLLAFVPSGFWPRLMSRVLSDPSIMRLAQVGCGLTDEECRLLKWTKWRTGMILRFGNVTLLSMEELSGKLFTGNGTKMAIMKDGGRWEEHPLDTTVYGVNVEVPDVFPLLRYAELNPNRIRIVQRSGSTGQQEEEGEEQEEERVRRPRQHLGDITEDPRERSFSDSMRTPPTQPPAASGSRNKRWTISEKVGSIARKVRSYTNIADINDSLTLPPTSSVSQSPRVASGFVVLPDHHSNSSSSDSEDEKKDKEEEEGESTGGIGRVRGVLRKEEIQTQFEELKKKRAHGHHPGAIWNNDFNTMSSNGPPKLTEENNDRMRAGLLSKVVDHITLLVEDWFTGVRPRFLVVPCPHCSHGLTGPTQGSDRIPFLRSFSINPQVRPPNDLVDSSFYPYSAPTQAHIASTIASQSSVPQQRSRWGWGRGQGASPVPAPTPTPNVVFYAFQYEECVVRARDVPYVKCPVHGELPLEYIAPDTLFLTEGRDVLLQPDEVLKKERLGRGAFATVYHAQIKRKLPNGQIHFEDVAIKALGNKGEDLDDDDDEDISLDEEEERPGGDDEYDGENAREPPPIQRSAIISGFNNLKKELSILSPLRHPYIIQLFGVSARPLGLVLELAPKGSLKSLLKEYSEAQTHIQSSAMQAVTLQISDALKYLHDLRIIYRDLKSDNVLVWQFPSPYDVLVPALPVHTDVVKVKLSDYGISQFASTQGAKGLVGTPGFMAPEILMYYGKEAYNEKVDIFSFAMLIYEMITFRLPFEHLTPSQANQANENGARPTLKRIDLPCPVLIRELMVWCWQQSEELRPTASQITKVSQMDQFLRLADAIRVNNFGSQVAGSCYRILKSPVFKPSLTPHTPGHHSFPFVPSLKSQGASPLRTSIKASSIPTNETGSRAAVSNQPQSKIDSNPNQVDINPKEEGLLSKACNESGHNLMFNSTEKQLLEAAAEIRANETSLPLTEAQNVIEDLVSPMSTSSASSSVHFKPQAYVTEEGESKHRIPPSLQILPDIGEGEEREREGEEDNHRFYQVWVVSSSNHNSVATVVDYCGQFMKIEDVDLGDSPVLAISMVHDKVWIGFEIGYLCIYDADTHNTLAQVWIRRGIAVQSIAHIPQLSQVYVGLANGTILSYSDIITPISNDDDSVPLIATHLTPLSTYKEPNEICPVILPIMVKPWNEEEGREEEGIAFHLWVGQKNKSITVLNAEDLSIVDFLDTPDDTTPCPSYLDQVPFYYLTSSVSPKDSEDSESILLREDALEPVWVYGALRHGQFVTVWDGASRKIKTCFNVLDLLPHWKEDAMPSVSALYCSSSYMYIGLVTGEILVLDHLHLSLLTTLHCHRSNVHSFLSIDLRKLLPPQQEYQGLGAMTPTVYPSHPFLTNSDQSDVKYKTGPLQLMSFGTGFRAYYESNDTIDYTKSSFLLVWEAAGWGKNVLSQEKRQD